jgi:hypothetical protein
MNTVIIFESALLVWMFYTFRIEGNLSYKNYKELLNVFSNGKSVSSRHFTLAGYDGALFFSQKHDAVDIIICCVF